MNHCPMDPAFRDATCADRLAVLPCVGDPLYLNDQTAGGPGGCGHKSVTLSVIIKNRMGTDL